MESEELSVEPREWNVGGVWSEECGVWSVKCGVKSVACKVQSVKCKSRV